VQQGDGEKQGKQQQGQQIDRGQPASVPIQAGAPAISAK
jgi:hypothetical protein